MKEKVEAIIRLDANREMIVKGRITNERKIFGRDEVLLEDIEVEPLWITREKVKF